MEKRVNIQELPEEFDGRGEVLGYQFKLVEQTENGYIYAVKSANRIYYEVFKRVLRPVILDSVKMTLSDEDFVVSYPRSTVFGVTAWTCVELEKAQERLAKFNKQDEDAGESGERGDNSGNTEEKESNL